MKRAKGKTTRWSLSVAMLLTGGLLFAACDTASDEATQRSESDETENPLKAGGAAALLHCRSLQTESAQAPLADDFDIRMTLAGAAGAAPKGAGFTLTGGIRIIPLNTQVCSETQYAVGTLSGLNKKTGGHVVVRPSRANAPCIPWDQIRIVAPGDGSLEEALYNCEGGEVEKTIAEHAVSGENLVCSNLPLKFQQLAQDTALEGQPQAEVVYEAQLVCEVRAGYVVPAELANEEPTSEEPATEQPAANEPNGSDEPAPVCEDSEDTCLERAGAAAVIRCESAEGTEKFDIHMALLGAAGAGPKGRAVALTGYVAMEPLDSSVCNETQYAGLVLGGLNVIAGGHLVVRGGQDNAPCIPWDRIRIVAPGDGSLEEALYNCEGGEVEKTIADHTVSGENLVCTNLPLKFQQVAEDTLLKRNPQAEVVYEAQLVCEFRAGYLVN